MQLMFIQMNCVLQTRGYDLMDANKKVDLGACCNVYQEADSDEYYYDSSVMISMQASTSVYLKETYITLEDFRTILHLPQANDNSHASFVPPPFIPLLWLHFNKCWIYNGLKTVSNLRHLVFYSLGRRYARYSPKLMWEGIYYSLHHPATSIPYPRFTKIIISHYMTIFPEISRRARDAYHNLQDDDIMKNIFNSGRNKNKVGMRIPAWMITEEMKPYGDYKMQSARLTPPVPVPTAEKADEMILQDTIQVSLAEHKSREEQEARENVALNVDDSSPPRHDDTSIPGTRLEPRSDKESPEVEIVQEKEEETTPMVDVTNIVIPVNVDDEEDEITDEVFELRRRAKGKNVEETRLHQFLTYRSPRNFLYLSVDLWKKTTKEETERLSLLKYLARKSGVCKHISSQIQNAIDNAIPSLVDASVRSYMSGHILHVHPAQVQSSSVPEQQYQLYLAMKADPLLQQQDIAIWLALQMKFEKTQVPQTACRYSAVRTRDQDDPHDDAHPEGENSAKRQKTSEYEAYVSGESSSGQENVEEPGPSTSGNQEQDDEFDFWTDSYASDDDEIPTKQVTQDIMEEISLTIDEAKIAIGLISIHQEFSDMGKKLTNDEVEFLKLFEEEIEVRLNYQDQMRRWEMYVNGRPLGPRRERPE
ncbi:hypothetical protein Tco_1363583 [Tanacetum coccineum]